MPKTNPSNQEILNIVSKTISFALKNGHSTQDILNNCFDEWHDHPIINKVMDILRGKYSQQIIQTRLSPEPETPVITSEQSGDEKSDALRAMGYTGGKCKECGAMMMRQSGACEVCDVCGSTSGCS